MRAATRSSFFAGRRLFDRGLFFEAHEVWEKAWLTESGSVRVLLQGLIQVAAALHKASRAEHPLGCLRLFDAGLEKLETARDAVPACPLAKFRTATQATRERARAWAQGERGPLAPDEFPRFSRLSVPAYRKRPAPVGKRRES